MEAVLYFIPESGTLESLLNPLIKQGFLCDTANPQTRRHVLVN